MIAKEYVPAIAAEIAGTLTILSPFITWRLKNASDERARRTALDKEIREKIKQLYIDVSALFEQAVVAQCRVTGEWLVPTDDRADTPCVAVGRNAARAGATSLSCEPLPEVAQAKRQFPAATVLPPRACVEA